MNTNKKFEIGKVFFKHRFFQMLHIRCIMHMGRELCSDSRIFFMRKALHLNDLCNSPFALVESVKP